MNQDNKIAVIGCGLRFPGGIFNYYDYYNLLLNKLDGIVDVPTDRWAPSTYYNLDVTVPGSINNTKGGFLKNINKFDAGFFGISPAEAKLMDPQIRLSLELAFETIENAGYPMHKIKGSSTGVFMGASFNDYRDLCYKNVETGIASNTITGNTNCCISGRVAYFLGLEGPAITIDTACSSSLVAIHYAINDLLSRDVDHALAGGVNIIINPENHMAFSSINALSPDGICYSFDSRANGYVRSEGGGILLLKRLEDAVKCKDDILGVIVASKVNNDGFSKSFTTPNPLAQEKLIRHVIEKARIKADELDYIEAHGPGTYVGDPIELDALSKVFDFSGRNNTLYVGSVKSNIGHTESASGVASLLKAIISVKEQTIFPNLNFNYPNPRFNWDNSCIKIPVNAIELKKEMLVGINSFGISGTNVHLIVCSAPETKQLSKQDLPFQLPLLLPLSAADEEALIMRKEQIAEWLNEDKGNVYSKIATFARFHSQLLKRKCIYGNTPDELLSKLNNNVGIQTISENLNLQNAPKVFLFSGQGGLWQGMGIELLKIFPVFKSEFEKCALIINELLDVDLYSFLTLIPENEIYRQALTFSYQIALAELWVNFGITPDIVLGHSLGEIVAACFAEIIDKKTAIQIIIARGNAINLVAGQGTMWVAGISEETFLNNYSDIFPEIDIAAINGIETIVLSGTESKLQEFGKILDSIEVFNSRTQINYASHSRYILPAIESFGKDIPDYTPVLSTRCRMFSTSTLKFLDPSQLTKEYWLANLQKPVKFCKAVEILSDFNDLFAIELSSHSLLSTLASQIISTHGYKAIWASSCIKDHSEVDSLSVTIGKAFESGLNINWDTWYEKTGGRNIKIPEYPFNRKEYWVGVNTQDSNKAPIIMPEIISSKYDGLDWEDLITNLIAEIIYLSPQRINSEDSFKDIGFDSLMILRLKKRLEEIRNIQIKATVFWNYPNIRLLSNYLRLNFSGQQYSTLNKMEYADSSDRLNVSDEEISNAIDKYII